MAKNNRHNAAFVVGSVVGAVAGAAAALWKTPYSGEELRAKVTGAKSESQTAEPGVAMTSRAGDRSIKNKVLSGVEKTLAPIVGVELGKTANGSGAVAGSDIKVNPDHAGTISNRRAWQGDSSSASTSTTTTSDGTPIIGLSRDKVDADKWAAAYSGESTAPASAPATAPATTSSDTIVPSASTSTTSAAATSATSETGSGGDGGWIRHPHAWKGNETSAGTSTTASADGTPIIGLSRDKVDAEKWAAAYSGETIVSETASTTASTTAAGTSNRSSTDRDATSAPSNAAAESAAKTGQGAAPAYSGQESPGHAPVDKVAPESNVAPVSRQGREARTVEHSTADAATITQLTTPQTDRIPDSLRQPTERSTHPFPKLGGKE